MPGAKTLSVVIVTVCLASAACAQTSPNSETAWNQKKIDAQTALNQRWAEQAFSIPAEQPATASDRLVVVKADVPFFMKAGKSATGKPLRLGDKTYIHGIGVNANSTLRVYLNRPAKRLIADIGLDKSVENTQGSVVFQIRIKANGEVKSLDVPQERTKTFDAILSDAGDTERHNQANGADALAHDKNLFTTGVIKANGEVKSIDVPLEGVKTFDLIVGDAGDSPQYDQADWANAKVILADGNEIWLDELAKQASVQSDLPFSFVYGGKHSSEFISNWSSTFSDEKIDETKTRRTIIFNDPNTKLEVKAVVTMYADTPGTDWTLFFTNKGSEDTPVIENVKAVDVKITAAGLNETSLHRLHGTTSGVAFSFDDFQPIDDVLQRGKKIDFGVSAAWSSFEFLPFFNLRWGSGGVITAIGWTGHWGASVEYKEDGLLNLEAGMREMHLKLHPGESIRSPRILQLYWSGEDENFSYNIFRRTMLSHIVPKINGKTVTPPIAHVTSTFYELTATTEQIERSYIESFKNLGFEYYWLDAWWMKDGLPAGVGHYGFPIDRVPDPNDFPNGLKPLGDLAHKEGLKFIVWFSPEGVSPNTCIGEHPQWVLSHQKDNPAGTFNLGIPQAREYMTKYLNAVIKEYGIDCFRTDGGPALSHFKLGDTDPNRAGLTEIRHVEGLYRMWDDILNANPGIFIDNCCAGGSRIDLETCSRSLPLWRTDGAVWTLFSNDIEKAAVQNQAITLSLNRYVPFSTEAQMGAQPYYFRSAFNGGIVFAEDTRPAGYPRDLLKKAITEGKRIRKYFFGNFYPLSEFSTSFTQWCVFQYHRPAENDGIVLAFRRPQSPYTAYNCKLREIDPNAEYEVTFAYTYDGSRPVKMKGSELENLKFTLEQAPSSVLVEYKYIGRP